MTSAFFPSYGLTIVRPHKASLHFCTIYVKIYKQKVTIFVAQTYVAKKEDVLGFSLLRNAPKCYNFKTFLFSLSTDRGREFLCRCRSKGYWGWWLCGRHILQESIVSQQRWRRRQRHGGRGRRPGSHRGHIRRLCLSQRERDCCCCRGRPPRRPRLHC